MTQGLILISDWSVERRSPTFLVSAKFRNNQWYFKKFGGEPDIFKSQCHLFLQLINFQKNY